MTYQIENKNDLTGAMLVVRFPQEDLDEKALYTIEADQPPFLVPFRYRAVDGMAECTYCLGSRSKLQYRFGAHAAADYVDFWTQVLQPLLDCDDWFLKPFSFVLDPRYLYADRDGAVSYLYIPAKTDGESFASLREMVLELSRQNSVTDPALENKVLRALMQDFQPKAFLDMLRAEGGVKTAQAKPEPAPDAVSAPAARPAREEPPRFQLPQQLRPQEPEPEPVPQSAPQPIPAADDGDIHINFGGTPPKSKEKPPKEHRGLFGGKKEKKEKEPKARKPLFGKKEKPREVLLGAAEPQPVPVYQPPAARPAQPAVSYDEERADGVTQLDDEPMGGVCCLRLVGEPGLPREIAVDIQPGRAFTIGRFDVSVGQKQSDFEFEKNTRAVSRRHAAIEREESGYFLVDLASSAGTFVNGQKLIPNVPQALENGCRVSFGTGGADYIWNE